MDWSDRKGDKDDYALAEHECTVAVRTRGNRPEGTVVWSHGRSLPRTDGVLGSRRAARMGARLAVSQELMATGPDEPGDRRQLLAVRGVAVAPPQAVRANDRSPRGEGNGFYHRLDRGRGDDGTMLRLGHGRGHAPVRVPPGR